MIYVEEKKTASADDVEQWCELVGDSNAIHLDKAYAEESRFGERIVPGMMMLGWVSDCIEQMGGEDDAVLLRTECQFNKPVPLEEEVKVVVEAMQSPENEDVYIAEYEVRIDREAMVDGGAKVLLD